MADKAKAAVQDFMSKHGKHDTTVHEKVAPAVTHEAVKPTQHENVTTAIDKEIHQHHYHTSVQPVTDQQVLPEKHKHNLVGVEHRSFDHGNAAETEQRVRQESAKFKDERVTGATEHTHSVAPVVGGEHIHHHVHENIQPVIQRETIQPTVVHTTVPIHETHHNAAQHHTTSALPAVSMTDFKGQGGTLGGRAERHDAFEGEPRSVGGALSGSANDYQTPGRNTATTGTTGTGSGLTGSSTTGTGSGLTGTRDNYGTTGTTTGTGSGLTGTRDNYGTTGTTGTTGGSHLPGTGHHHTSGTAGSSLAGGRAGGGIDSPGSANLTGNTGSKASTAAKMDPRVDADGDGKRGVMD